MEIIATINRICDECKAETECYVFKNKRMLCKDCYDIEREKLNS